MTLNRRRFVSSTALALSSSFLPTFAAPLNVRGQGAAPRYAIEEIGVLDGDDASFAFAISPRGWVTGMSRSSTLGTNQAFIYRDGETRARPTESGSSVGWSINKSAQIAGFVSLASTNSAAVLWTGSDVSILPTLGGAGAQAYGINDDGSVVGGSQLEPDGPYQACIWQNGVVTALSSRGGVSLASAINNAGQVAGSSSESTNPTDPGSHATRWQGDDLLDLGTIAGPTSLARSINDFGQIVGHTTTTADGQFGLDGTHAFLWEEEQMIDLRALPGANVSFGWDINAAGLIAGSSANPSPPSDGSASNLAVIWSSRKIIDLNTLIPADSGWILTTAYGLNDAGQIVGIGMVNGAQRGFVLTPEEN